MRSDQDRAPALWFPAIDIQTVQSPCFGVRAVRPLANKFPGQKNAGNEYAPRRMSIMRQRGLSQVTPHVLGKPDGAPTHDALPEMSPPIPKPSKRTRHCMTDGPRAARLCSRPGAIGGAGNPHAPR